MATRNHTGRNPQSTLNGIASRTTTEAAQAPTNPGLNTGASTNFSGQYLYDRFVNVDVEVTQEAVTRLQIVKQAVGQVDTASFKKSLAEMVKIAKETKDKNTLRNAQNVQNQLRVVYGALKNAPDVLQSKGFNDNLGLYKAVDLSRDVLKEKAIKWDGTKVIPAEARREVAAQKKDMVVLQQLQKDNPIMKDETITAYNERIMKMYPQALEESRQAEHDKVVEAQAMRVIEAFPDHAGDIAEYILTWLAEQENADQPAEQGAAAPQREPALH